MTVVVDHDTRALLWAAPGRDKATVQRFFDELGPGGCARISHVSVDGAAYIADVVDAACPNAVRCADPFYADLLVMPMWAWDRLLDRRGAVVRSA